MSFPKILAFMTIILFGGIFVASLVKKNSEGVASDSQRENSVVIDLEDEGTEPLANEGEGRQIEGIVYSDEDLPDADRIEEIFSVGASSLSLVKTITYTSRVSWVKGRPAWIADYATHYKTSRYFISRSLTGEKDYFAHSIVNGDRFNVYDPDKDIAFHLVVDTSRFKMWLYYVDMNNKETVLLKRYDVGLGRRDDKRTSGSLTPHGVYSLGYKVALYKPGVKGYFNHKKIEMIRVFGTRWIPFEKEIKGCTASAKGLGLHGVPWRFDETKKGYDEYVESIGEYDSDGCIRMNTADVEELFSIIITKPSYIQLVSDFYKADISAVENLEIR
jgi:hypothetical protein